MMGSPWLEEYERRRPLLKMSGDTAVDVAVVGGGISGLLTAYFLLEGTDLSVSVIEQGLVGHGATGHNGGQVVGAFERGYEELSEVLGKERVDRGYQEVEEAWGNLDALLTDIGQPPLQRVPALLGVALRDDLDQWVAELETRRRLGLSGATLRVARDVSAPPGAVVVAREEIDRLMWSRGRHFIAALESEVGLLNSYELCERIALALLERHPQRFRIWERASVEGMAVEREGVTMSTGGWTVRAGRAVLCTNGYRSPPITAPAEPALEGVVQGVIGYMVGMTSATGHAGARAYFMGGEEPYFYLTRREHADSWLTAVGGPEELAVDGQGPAGRSAAFRRIEEFIEGTLSGPRGLRDHYWLGLMGYTPSGARAAGRDPVLPRLYYNLGCNGIGLLTAVAGADRLARMMNGRPPAPSMFDPEAALLLNKEKRAQRAR